MSVAVVNRWALMLMATALSACQAPPPATVETTTVTATETVTPTITQTVTYTPPPPPGPAITMIDGIFLVGTDIAAGSYKTGGPPESGDGMCAWTLLPSKGASLADATGGNTLFGPGYLEVADGQIVQTVGRCTWVKE